MAADAICSDFGAQENKICPCYYPRSGETRCHALRFFDVEFQASSFTVN